MYEQFKNQFTTLLFNHFSVNEIEIISQSLDMAAYDYDIQRKETALAPYNSEIPKLVKTYLVCKKIEGLSEQTLYNYGRYLQMFFFEIQKAPEQVTANDIRVFLYQYQEIRKVSNRTLDKYREYISRFYQWACDEGYIEKNPTRVVKPIKYEVKPREALSQIDLEYLRKACETVREKAIIEVLYSTGCRVSELTRLKKSDVNWGEKSVHLFGKGNKHRTSFLNAKAEVTLKEYLDSRTDEGDSLFVSERKPHNPIKKDALEKIVRNISKRASDKVDKRVTPHTLRHTTATNMVENNADITSVQIILGHKNINTTMIYAHKSLSSAKRDHIRTVV